MRRAAKADKSQRSIVSALRGIGAYVTYIKQPVDLLVGFKGRTLLLEVKEPGGFLTARQREFFATFRGEAYIVHGVEDALQAVMATP